MGRVAPAKVARQVGRVDRPVAGAGRALYAAAERVARCAAVDFTRGQKRANLEVQVIRRLIGAPQHRADQLAARKLLAHPHAQRRVEVAIHRVELVGMPDDHDPAGVVRAGVDDLAIGDHIDACAGCVARDGVPVLAGVPVAGVVPGVLDLGAMANKETVAKWFTWHPNRVTKQRSGCRRGHGRR